MKLKIMDAKATEKGSIDLPEQFNEQVREDLVKRAVLSLQMGDRQPYGAFPEAGKRASAYVSKRRRDYRTTYGIGQSRTPRKIMSRSGTRMQWVGAFAPQTVGGRQSHPPKASKIWEQKINEKENRKAIRSAISSTIKVDVVKARGHRVPAKYPFILSDEIQKFKKTSEVVKSLEALGFKDELERTSDKKIRAGKGKTRGRKHKTRKGVLFVVGQDCELIKSARNILGTDIVVIDNLNAELLAPGTKPGRLTLFTESAIKRLTQNKLFTQDVMQDKVQTTKGKEKKLAMLKAKEPKKAKSEPKKKKVSKSKKQEEDEQ
jgi:large subunit ribosomal protein L4e